MTDYTHAPTLAPETASGSLESVQDPAPKARKLKLGSIRAQFSRERRKNGMRCLTLEIRDEEISALIRLGLLASAARSDREAIKSAIYSHLDRTLG